VSCSPSNHVGSELIYRMLFRHQDLSLIKDFCRQEWTKILQGRVSIQDFVVAKEVRLGSYSYVGFLLILSLIGK
jgi:DNA polymerase zeta